jgi:hypothetical protein
MGIDDDVNFANGMSNIGVKRHHRLRTFSSGYNVHVLRHRDRSSDAGQQSVPIADAARKGTTGAIP